MRSQQRPTVPAAFSIDPKNLTVACAAVAEWLQGAGPEERVQVLEALQVSARATNESATVTGVLPLKPPHLAPVNSDAHAGERALGAGGLEQLADS